MWDHMSPVLRWAGRGYRERIHRRGAEGEEGEEQKETQHQGTEAQRSEGRRNGFYRRGAEGEEDAEAGRSRKASFLFPANHKSLVAHHGRAKRDLTPRSEGSEAVWCRFGEIRGI